MEQVTQTIEKVDTANMMTTELANTIVRQNVILDNNFEGGVDVNDRIPPAFQVVDHKGRE